MEEIEEFFCLLNQLHLNKLHPMSFVQILAQMGIIFGVVIVGYIATRIGVWKVEMNRNMSVFVLAMRVN